MPNVRPIAKNSKWKLTQYEFLTAYNYALQYNEWKDEYNSILYALRSPSLSGMPHSSGTSNPTEAQGLKAFELKGKMSLIEEVVHESNSELYPWLLKAVTDKVPYHYLRNVMQIPCGKNVFYESRRKFYFLLYKHISNKINC